MKKFIITAAMLTIAAGLTACGPSDHIGPQLRSGKGGSGLTVSQGGGQSWASRPDLVTPSGEVKVKETETKVDHPPTAPTDSGFEGGGPLSIEG